MAQNYFFHDSEAIQFPTRGHIPMFYKITFLVPKGVFHPLRPIFGPNSSKWPIGLWSMEILKMVMTSYFEDFWDFEDPPRAKKVLFLKNSKKNLEIYSSGSQKSRIVQIWLSIMLESSCITLNKWVILGNLAPPSPPQKRPIIKFYIECLTDNQRYTLGDATNQKQSIYTQLLFGHLEEMVSSRAIPTDV